MDEVWPFHHCAADGLGEIERLLRNEGHLKKAFYNCFISKYTHLF